MYKKLTQKEAEEKSLAVGIKMIGTYINSKTKIEFECPICKNIFLTMPNTVLCKKVKSCGHCWETIKIQDKINNFTILEIKHQRKGSKIKAQCICGNIWTGPANCIVSGHIKSCGCQSSIRTSIRCWQGTKDISRSYFGHVGLHAKKRNLEFNITLEYLQELLEQQNYKCNLTGLIIKCTRNRNKNRSTYEEQTASLDRIDSSIGYIEGNVQWVHKDVNKMKQNLPEKRFIKLCKLIAKKTKKSSKIST